MCTLGVILGPYCTARAIASLRIKSTSPSTNMVNPARRSTNSMKDPAPYPQHIITFSKKKGREALFLLFLVLDQMPELEISVLCTAA